MTPLAFLYLAILYFALLVVIAGFVLFRAIPAVRSYFSYRGKRLVTCPETKRAAAVDVAAGSAALQSFFTEPKLHLNQCSRWPERQGCGQDCLQQVEAGPEDCLVWNIISDWYLGKSCIYCHKPFGELHRLDHAPALAGPDLKSVEWNQFRPEQLPEVLSTYRPVCWNCHVTETFRHDRPELVIERHR